MRALLVLLVLVSGPTWAAGKIVCWNDDKGQRVCGDRVPPQYAASERKVLDKNGRVIDTLERELSDEELAAQTRQREATQDAERRAREQAAQDRYLLLTYSSPEDLIDARNQRLEAIDRQIAMVDSAVAKADGALAALNEQKTSTPDDEEVLTRIGQFQVSLAESTKSQNSLLKEREAVCSEFNRNLQRFLLLKSLPPQPSADCPAPSSLADPQSASGAPYAQT